MQISQNIFKILLFTSCLFLSCGKVDLKQAEKSNVKPTLSLENLSRFTYVAIKYTGPYEDFDLLKKEFLYEIEKQQIISTGSPFIIYYNNPENTPSKNLEWEIGVPTAEGTMVEEPLILKKWVYERVAKVEKDEATPILKNIYPLILEQVSENNLTYQGPTAIRILNNIGDESSNTEKTEIWIPLAANSHLAE